MFQAPERAKTGQFEATLCGCCSDCSACCYGYWCAPCALAHTWADVRGEACTCNHCCIHGMWIRTNIRHARGLPPNLCADACCYNVCPCCSLVRDMREYKAIMLLNGVPGTQI